VPYFNLGLHAKYLRRWEDSFRCNRRATQLDDQDDGAWWNLGIAATALGDWSTIRWLCTECSRGNPGPHGCTAQAGENPMRCFVIAALTENDVHAAIDTLSQRSSGLRCLGSRLVVAA
jgi:hypothetical protein